MQNSNGIPLFAGAAEADDLFIASMDNMAKDTTMMIEKANPLLAFLDDQNKIEKVDKIDLTKNVNIVDKENSTVKDFTHYDNVDRTPQEALTQARYVYGHIVGTQTYSREELVKNENKIVDLVETKTEQLTHSMRNHFNDKLIGTGAADGRSAAGLGQLMAVNGVSGGIDPTQAGFEYWNPQNFDNAGVPYSLATDFRPGMRKAFRDLKIVGLSEPDVIFCGEDVYDTHQAWAEDKLRINISEIQDEKGWSDFNMFTAKNKCYVYEPSLDPKLAWLMNSNQGFKVRVHKGTNFVFDDWRFIDGKQAKSRDCMVYYTVYSKRRNANGIIQFS